MVKFSFEERVNTDIVNSNQIQNLYNYILKIREKNKILMLKLQEGEKIRNDFEEKNRKLKENDEYIKVLQFENK